MADNEENAPPSTEVPSTPMRSSPARKEEGAAEASPKASMKRPAARKMVTPKKVPKKKAETPKKVQKKPKSQASPKVKDKASALAKAKATPKKLVFKKPSLKRPAAAEPPLQAGKSNKSSSSMAWAHKLKVKEKETEKNSEEQAEEEEDSGADDQEIDPGASCFEMEGDQEDKKKDRSKDAKFKMLLASNSLPKWAVDAWNDTKKLRTGRPAAQRKLVNQIITRDLKTSQLSLNLSNPALSELKSCYSKTESKDTHKALRKTLFKGKFNLTEDAFQEGLTAGEFAEVVGEDGKVRYSWQSLQHTSAKGSGSEAQLKSEAFLTKKDAKFESMRVGSCFFGLFKKTKGQLALPGSGQTLALCDKEVELTPELWTQAQAQLSQAKEFWDKHIRDAKKLLQQLGDDNKQDDLYVELLLITGFSFPLFLFRTTSSHILCKSSVTYIAPSSS